MLLESVWKQFLRRKGFSPWILLVPFMWLASLVYGVLLTIRRKQVTPRKRLRIPVVSIGNISVGGTGKTPMVEFLARLLIADGIRVGVVSSGWGRESTASFVEPGFRVQEMPVSKTGDEVLFLAKLLPKALFSVGSVKWEAAEKLAQSEQVDLIIVDDGFQHWQLPRDFDIVTFDATVERNQWRLFPLGRLREPLSALGRADVIITTRSNFTQEVTQLQKSLKSYAPNAELYHAGFSVSELIGKEKRNPITFLKDKSVTIFAGIGNFHSFHQQVASLSGGIDAVIELSDHQTYTDALREWIAQTAAKHNSDLLVTTGKDWVKLGDFDFGRPIYYLAQSIDLAPGTEKLVRQIKTKLGLKTAKQQ